MIRGVCQFDEDEQSVVRTMLDGFDHQANKSDCCAPTATPGRLLRAANSGERELLDHEASDDLGLLRGRQPW